MRILLPPTQTHTPCPYETEALLERLQTRGHTVETLPAGRWSALRLFVVARHANLLVVGSEVSHACAARLARLVFGTKYILLPAEAHLNRFRHWPLFPWLVRSAYHAAHRALPLNVATRDALIHFGVRRQSLLLSPPPAATVAWEAHAAGTVVAPLPAHAMHTAPALLRALACLLERVPGVQLSLLTTEDAIPALEERIRTMGLEANARCSSAPCAPGTGGAVAVFCARDETPEAAFAFSAMASGWPLVVVRHPLLVDWFKDGETALLVAPGDESGLADALAQVLENPHRASLRALAAQERAAARHRWEDFLDALLPPA